MKIDPTKTHEVLQHKHDRPLTACRFDPTGRYVFFGAEDNLVHRFDLKSKSVTPFAAHDSWVRAISCSPDGKTLYTGGYDGRLIFWPAAADKPAPLRTIDAHNGWLRALAVSPSGDRIATCGNDNLVKLWDAADGKLVAELSGHTSHVYNVAFDPTGETLISCDLKGVLKQWDVATGALQRDLTPAASLYKYDNSFRADIGGARCITFSEDGAQLAVGGITNVTNAFAGIGHAHIVLINMADGKLALQLEAKDKVNGTAWGVAHHPGVMGKHKPEAQARGPAAGTGSSPAIAFWIALTGGGGGGWLCFFKPDAPASTTSKDNAAKDNAAKDNAAKDGTAKTNTANAAPTTTNEFFKLKLPSDGRDLTLAPDKTQLAVAHADKTLRLYALHEK